MTLSNPDDRAPDCIGDGAAKSAPPGPRERKKQEKRARIVAAARSLFADKGFHNVTTLEIAEAAGIGSGTLFLYTPTKEDLLVLVFRDEMIEVVNSVFDSLSRDVAVEQRLIGAFMSMMAYHDRDRDVASILLMKIAFATKGEPNADVSDLMSTILGRLDDLLASARERGELRSGFDVRRTSENLFASYFLGLLDWLLNGRGEAWFLERMTRHVALTLRGLRVS